MKQLISDIKSCEVCKSNLPLGPRPVIAAHPDARIAIIGQAPGTKVHASGVPWDDASGKQLRKWLNISDSLFYDETKIAIVPMGFCYPGKGKTGDLPPRKECAPLWHEPLFKAMPKLEFMLLIGQYAQQYYLKTNAERNLTETVRVYHQYLPKFFPLPHPSPRNRFWITKNPWFEKDVIPVLQQTVKEVLENQ